MDDLLKLIHVAAGFLLVAGLIGRGLTMRSARQSADIDTVDALLRLAGIFERVLVIPPSGIVVVAGLVTMWAQDRSLFGAGQRWLFVSLGLFLTLVPVIVWIFVPKGKRFDHAFQDARSRGSVTPELSAAFRDPVVAAAHAYELGVVGVILVLMVLKPF
jgi:uncharacterized membrane protein